MAFDATGSGRTGTEVPDPAALEKAIRSLTHLQTFADATELLKTIRSLMRAVAECPEPADRIRLSKLLIPFIDRADFSSTRDRFIEGMMRDIASGLGKDPGDDAAYQERALAELDSILVECPDADLRAEFVNRFSNVLQVQPALAEALMSRWPAGVRGTPTRLIVLKQMAEQGLFDPSHPHTIKAVGPILGQGAFGTTLLVQGADGQFYALTFLQHETQEQSVYHWQKVMNAESFDMAMKIFERSGSTTRPNEVLRGVQADQANVSMALAPAKIDMATQVFDGVQVTIPDKGESFTYTHRVAQTQGASDSYKRVDVAPGVSAWSLPVDEQRRALLAADVVSMVLQFAGLPADRDRHSGNYMVDGTTITHFDFGYTPLHVPTETQRTDFGKRMGGMIRESFSHKGLYVEHFKEMILPFAIAVNHPSCDPVIRESFIKALGGDGKKIMAELTRMAHESGITVAHVKAPSEIKVPEVDPQYRALSEAVERLVPEHALTSQMAGRSAANNGMGGLLGVWGIAHKLGGKDSSYQQDMHSGDAKRQAAAQVGLGADIANVGFSGISTAHDVVVAQSAKKAMGEAYKVIYQAVTSEGGEDVLKTIPRVIVGEAPLALRVVGKVAGKAFIPLALLSGGLDAYAGDQAGDRDRVAGAIGGTLGGIGAGLAAGAMLGAAGGTCIIPGAGTVVGGVVVGIGFGIVGAFVGEKTVQKFASGMIGKVTGIDQKFAEAIKGIDQKTLQLVDLNHDGKVTVEELHQFLKLANKDSIAALDGKVDKLKAADLQRAIATIAVDPHLTQKLAKLKAHAQGKDGHMLDDLLHNIQNLPKQIHIHGLF